MSKFDIVCKASDRMNEKNDCTVKALSIACRVPYNTAHDALKQMGRKKGKGATNAQWMEAIYLLGCEFEETLWPKQKNGSSYTPKTIGKAYKRGYYVVHFRGHVAAMINGEIQDWTVGRKHRVLAVYKVTVPKGSRS